MNLDDIKQILELVRDHNLAEFEIERDGLKVRIRKAGHEPPVFVAPSVALPAPVASGGPAAIASPSSGAAAEAPAEAAESVNLAVIKSPIVGTFYRSPEPS